MGQKRSSKRIPNPDEKEFGEAGQKASDKTFELMVYMFEPNPWLEISFLIQTQVQSTSKNMSENRPAN